MVNRVLIFGFIFFAGLTVIAGEKLFDYIPESPAVIGYVNVVSLRGTWLESELKKLNVKYSKEADGGFDFASRSEQWESAAMAMHGTLKPTEQIFLIRANMKSDDFFVFMEESIKQTLAKSIYAKRPLAIFPPESVNRNIRGKIELCAFYLEDDVIFIGDSKIGKNLFRKTGSKNGAVPVEFSSVPERAFMMFALRPLKIPMLVPFLGGVNFAYFFAELAADSRGVVISGKIECSSEKIAGELAPNLKFFATAFLPLLLSDEPGLSTLAVSRLITTSDGRNVDLKWDINEELANRLLAYLGNMSSCEKE